MSIATLSERLLARGWSLATAESCTGGLLASRLTDMAGASHWFRGSVVAYHMDIKAKLLAVPASLMDEQGVVSEAVAIAMAQGVCQTLDAQVGVGITGVAGPEGGSEATPVGTVCYAIVCGGEVFATTLHCEGDRMAVREASVQAIIDDLCDQLDE